MKVSWQTETDRLVCRWTEAGEHVKYNPPWMQEVSRSVDVTVSLSDLDFTALSPFGSGEWYVPRGARWSVSDR